MTQIEHQYANSVDVLTYVHLISGKPNVAIHFARLCRDKLFAERNRKNEIITFFASQLKAQPVTIEDHQKHEYLSRLRQTLLQGNHRLGYLSKTPTIVY